MPIEVTDILPEGAAAAEELDVAPPEEGVPEATPEEAPAPAPKKRGRPVGSKNKVKAASEAASEVAGEAASEVAGEVASEVAPAASPPKAKANARAKATAAPIESVHMKRAAPKRVPKPPPVCESESEEETPLSPTSQRRAQWAAYRQAQVDAHQARTAHYSKALDRMLAF